MTFKPPYAFAIVIVNVLAVVITSSGRSTGLVRLTELRDELDRPVYSWMIGQDEQERLSALLKGRLLRDGCRRHLRHLSPTGVLSLRQGDRVHRLGLHGTQAGRALARFHHRVAQSGSYPGGRAPRRLLLRLRPLDPCPR
ncbi:hypothetical protein OH76DRAFT_783757 [Lentinus brumalis]|uniref:Uncharacterized protein n=1 Tax=Lentinus brumalis TaxID=2498619 RepID=A0A371D3T1_9APHY|nr:hypothetical protein OH76DRAFT_783757 [Polyporus brumalis]